MTKSPPMNAWSLILLRAAVAVPLAVEAGFEPLSGSTSAVAISYLAAACLLAGLKARAWAMIAALGILPMVVYQSGPDLLILLPILAFLTISGPGACSLDAIRERSKRNAFRRRACHRQTLP